MPRLPKRRAGRAAAAALALFVLALPPGLSHAALAAAAASVFEALPFVAGGAWLPARLARVAPLLTCGCGGSLPAALSLPAIGLCWVTFGPWIALARTATALTTALLSARQSAPCGATAPDALGQLAGVGRAAFAAALAASLLPRAVRELWPPAAFFAGAAAGALAPCATAGLSAAAGLRWACPGAAAGILTTAGLFPRPAPRVEGAKTRRTAPALLLTLGAALWLCGTGGRGFLNPRLAGLAPAGAAATALAMLRGTGTSMAAPELLPVGLLAALALGSPVPEEAAAVLPVGLYPGLAVDFTGTVRPGGRAVGRAVILCCRADAQLLILPLERALPQRAGTWVRVRGRVQTGPDGLRLGATAAEPVAAPADPFAYF